MKRHGRVVPTTPSDSMVLWALLAPPLDRLSTGRESLVSTTSAPSGQARDSDKVVPVSQMNPE